MTIDFHNIMVMDCHTFPREAHVIPLDLISPRRHDDEDIIIISRRRGLHKSRWRTLLLQLNPSHLEIPTYTQ
jgi:hypothetical protein